MWTLARRLGSSGAGIRRPSGRRRDVQRAGCRLQAVSSQRRGLMHGTVVVIYGLGWLPFPEALCLCTLRWAAGRSASKIGGDAVASGRQTKRWSRRQARLLRHSLTGLSRSLPRHDACCMPDMVHTVRTETTAPTVFRDGGCRSAERGGSRPSGDAVARPRCTRRTSWRSRRSLLSR